MQPPSFLAAFNQEQRNWAPVMASRSCGVQQVEVEWINRARAGDGEAFGHLVEAYQVSVYNLCYRMLGNLQEAEDAAQETFLRAYQGIKGYDRQKSFSTWLLSIAAHYSIDQIRRRRMTSFLLRMFHTRICLAQNQLRRQLLAEEKNRSVSRLCSRLSARPTEQRSSCITGTISRMLKLQKRCN
jgi:RNA polymerase sigma factor (sigma-70 family)